MKKQVERGNGGFSGEFRSCVRVRGEMERSFDRSNDDSLPDGVRLKCSKTIIYYIYINKNVLKIIYLLFYHTQENNNNYYTRFGRLFVRFALARKFYLRHPAPGREKKKIAAVRDIGYLNRA